MFSIDLEPGVHIIKIAPDESLFRPGEGKRGRANPIGEASHMNTSTGYYYNPVLLNDAWGPLHYRDFVLQFKVLIQEGRTHYYEFSCDANKQTDGFFPKRGWANPKGPNGEEGIDKTQFEFRMISVDDDLVVKLR